MNSLALIKAVAPNKLVVTALEKKKKSQFDKAGKMINVIQFQPEVHIFLVFCVIKQVPVKHLCCTQKYDVCLEEKHLCD